MVSPPSFIRRALTPRLRGAPGYWFCWISNCYAAYEPARFILRFDMSAKYIIPSVLGSFAISYWAFVLIADKKIFGGTTPRTVASKEWWEETDRKFQAWPRTAGPPVVMNPISRQNFIIKSTDD